MEDGNDMLEYDEFGFDEEDLLRWRSHVRPLPLPSYQTPVGGIPFENTSDEMLLNLPPQMIAHVQRTAAQGGLQIVSPRQTPFSALMTRVKGGPRMVGDHVVGSIADPWLEWPTVDGRSLENLLPDEPVANDSEDKSARVKTRTSPLTQASHYLSDPILSCLVKGRAVIDLLRRDDVMGGADEFTRVLASAWGIGTKEIDDLDAFTLGIDGPLLRHAIKTDEVYATYYAPTHVKRCVSVGASQMTRHYLPADSAMDWSRMRTHCEAVFVLTCAIEGHPIKLMRSSALPGDAGAPSDRPNVLCFQPAAGTAWTFAADTFSISPAGMTKHARASAIPRDVLNSLSKYVSAVKPMSYALAAGYGARARKTTLLGHIEERGETIAESYRMMVMTISLGSARGKLAASAVRNCIYSALEAADLGTRLRIVRYIRIAREECKVHLGKDTVPDRLIEKLCDKFLKVGELIRVRIASEAARRGHTVEEWWADITAQAPDRYKLFAEGTKGWALVGLWLVFRCPTDRWDKLGSALNYSALRDAELGAVGSLALPSKKGSKERLLAAARAAVKNITKAYCGYYIGVGDVGMAMSDVAMEMGRTRTAEVLREASYLWIMRARAMRGTNVELIPKSQMNPSYNHFRVIAEPLDILIVPTPYRAYAAYKSEALESQVLRRPYKDYLANVERTRLSDIFKECPHPAYFIEATKLTQYLLKPHELGSDMERAWGMIVQDLGKIARIYGAQERSRSPSPSRKKAKTIASEPIYIAPPEPSIGGVSYWDITATMDTDRVEWVEDVLAKLGTEVEDIFIERVFVDTNDMMRQLLAMEATIASQPSGSNELVR